MHSLLDNLLDLLFPPRCAACRGRGALLCGRCAATCRRVTPAANRAQHERLASPYLATTAGAYIFEGALREAIHALKYHQQPRIAVPLGDLLADYVAAHPQSLDAIVPVPLHPERLRSRGYNQSALLAARLARRLGLPLLPEAVVRARHTGQQADLSRAERRANVAGAFRWQSPTPPPRRLLIVDDVLTTGATVEAVAAALHLAGAAVCHGLALARGL